MKIAIFASGEGSTFEYICDACASEKLNAQVVLLVCNKKKAGVVEKADGFNIPVFYFGPDVSEASLLEVLESLHIDLILLLGYNKIVSSNIIAKYKTLNLHPSLLPKYAGLYGKKVHQKVAESKDEKTGSTIHLVTDQVDEGPAVASVAIKIGLNRNPEIIEERVKSREKDLLLTLLQEICS